MSGLEIAGIVIGVIPIIVGAVERYRERQSRITFRNKEPFILRLIQTLKAQHYLLLSDIQITLTDAGVEYDRSAVQVSQSIFQDPKVVDAVDDFLGEDAGVYFDAIERCHMVLAELVANIESLGPMPQGLADLVKTYSSKGGRYELPKKVRFPVKRDALDKQIRDLDEATTTLSRIRENMTRLNLQVTLPTTSRQLATIASALSVVRRQAHKLYCAIAAAYPKPCHSEHEARLILRSQSGYIDSKLRKKGGKDLVFTLLFLPTMGNNTKTYKTDVKVGIGEEKGASDRTSTKVVIQAPTSLSQSPPRTAMDDLCRCIRRAREGKFFLDLFLSEESCLSYCHLQSSNSCIGIHPVESEHEFVPLQRLLEDRLTEPWLLNHRMALSLVITSSLLQLIETPWLRAPLTSKSVRFSKASLEAASVDFSTIPEPFVEEQFTHKAAKESSTKCKDCDIRDYMLELGILLLEIGNWKTLDGFKQGIVDSGQAPPDSRHALARDWVSASVHKCDILPFHRDIILRCIQCTFATSGPNLEWDDVVLRKSIAEHVLKPLRDNCPQQLRS